MAQSARKIDSPALAESCKAKTYLKAVGRRPAKKILSLSLYFWTITIRIQQFLGALEFGLQPYADFGATDWDYPNFGRCGFGLPGLSDPWIWIIRIIGPLDLDYPDYRIPGLGLPTLVGGYPWSTVIVFRGGELKTFSKNRK